MKSKGWIRLHRSIRDNWMWKGKKRTRLEAWIDLLMQAGHEERTIEYNGQVMMVGRGEIVFGLRDMAERWKWSPGKVNRFINVLITEQMVEQITRQPMTHLNICKYELYQTRRNSKENSDGYRDGTVTEQGRHIKKNYKELNKELKKELKKKSGEDKVHFYIDIWKLIHRRFGLEEMAYSGYTGLIVNAIKRLGADNVSKCTKLFLEDDDSEIRSISYFFREGIDSYLVGKKTTQADKNGTTNGEYRRTPTGYYVAYCKRCGKKCLPNNEFQLREGSPCCRLEYVSTPQQVLGSVQGG